MLKKLKIKFIAVIMTIVTVLFAAIFGCAVYLAKANIEKDSVQIMRSAAVQPMKPMPPAKPDDLQTERRTPFFTLTVERDGTLKAFGGDYYDLTDKELLQKLFDTAFKSNKQTGIISEYNLRYCKADPPNTQTFVFADISAENAMLGTLMQSYIIIGSIGYAVFFLITLLLAKWVVKPVEKAWNEQKQFIADASHELKTPLTVIMTNAEMLTDENCRRDEMRSFTGNILSMSKRMKGLVESLLELAKMDSGSKKAFHEQLDFSKLIMNSILPFEPLFYEKGMEITSDIESGIRVTGDKTKLGQIADILLDNAMKYSDPRFPVKVTLRRSGGHCLLSVTGKGEAISKSDCKNIFKRFYRLDKARSDGQSYGLGLSIAYGVAEEHGGKIWAESCGGENSFKVMLPLT